MDDDELLERFEANTLPAFPHEEHLHVVFANSGRATEVETLDFIRAGIQRMAGDSGKYHETRTAAWVRIVAVARRGFDGTFAEFLAQHPELVRRDLLSDYYSTGLLNSDDARALFVEPDLADLPR